MIRSQTCPESAMEDPHDPNETLPAMHSPNP